MLISNPAASPYFLPTVYVTAGLLGGILLVLLIRARFDLRRLGADVLFRRWWVWAIIAPVYALAVLGGGLTTTLLAGFLTVLGLREYARLVGLPAGYARVLLGMGLLAAPVALLSLEAFRLLPPLLLIAATLQPLLFQREAGGVRHLAFAALGWGYVAWLLAHLVLLSRYVEGGPGLLLVIGLATALSDVAAFVTGKRFGRRKLAPRLSPHKTWAGVTGSLIGAYAGAGLMAFALPSGLSPILMAALPLVVGLGAIWGDLLESAIKREFGAKDAGAWLPGFGGLLDRIDSLLLVVPLVFYVLRFAARS